MVKSYKDLLVWKQGMELAANCFFLTEAFPKREWYGLAGQIRRSSSSVPANVAEGSGRGTRKDYLQFLRIAQGSLRELETHLLLSVRVKLTTSDATDPILKQVDSVSYLLSRLIKALATRKTSPLEPLEPSEPSKPSEP